MGVYETKTTKMILEIANYVFEYGEFPLKGTFSSDKRDMGKALTRYRTGEDKLTKQQVELLSLLDDFIKKTEKNIAELESYYQLHGCLPISKTNRRLVEVMSSYKMGKVPITESQRKRLDKIGIFQSSTERMVRYIEQYYLHHFELPRPGKKTKEGYDMGNAIKGYRSGKRLLTLNQKERLEKLGINLSKAVIKEEPIFRTRIIKEASEKSLAQRIKRLKEEKERYSKTLSDNNKTL